MQNGPAATQAERRISGAPVTLASAAHCEERDVDQRSGLIMTVRKTRSRICQQEGGGALAMVGGVYDLRVVANTRQLFTPVP
jgi:hypothetical protein